MKTLVRLALVLLYGTDASALHVAGRSSTTHGCWSCARADLRPPRSTSTLMLDTESAVGDACMLLPYPPYPGVSPTLVRGEMELAELEDSSETRTQVFLNEDGTVTTGATDGPLPMAVCGLWQCGTESFQMVIQRTFTAPRSTYTVTRVYTGSVNAQSDGVEVVVGRMGFYPTDAEPAGLFGDDDGLGGATAIGYFSMDGNTLAELQNEADGA